jgi:RimJ/RimL family protein N-acetyltransferase
VLPDPVAIEGLGLRLREWTDADLPVMTELFDDAEVDRWTPLPSPFDAAAARAYLDQARARRREGRAIELAVTTDGRAALGEILLFVTVLDGPVEPFAELGYAIGAAHRGQGLAARAVRLMTGYAHETLGLRKVVLRINPANAASVAVADKSGFRLTADQPVVRREAELLTWCHES